MKNPTHTAYTVIRKSDEAAKGFWVAIGSAWTNRDGSFNVRLNALPVNGEIVVRPRKDEAQA